MEGVSRLSSFELGCVNEASLRADENNRQLLTAVNVAARKPGGFDHRRNIVVPREHERS
jgi:hypothetical protein